jgi:hypothetical protein
MIKGHPDTKNNIHQRFYNDLLKMDPLGATYNNEHKYDDEYIGPIKHRKMLKSFIKKYRKLIKNETKKETKKETENKSSIVFLEVMSTRLDQMENDLKYYLVPMSHLENPFKDIIDIIDRTFLDRPGNLGPFKKRIIKFVNSLPEYKKDLLTGMKKGPQYTMNDKVMEILIKDLNEIKLETKIGDFSMHDPEKYLEFMNSVFMPAVKDFVNFLQNEYIPKKELGICSRKLYGISSSEQLDIEIDPDILFNLGNKMVKELEIMKNEIISDFVKNNNFKTKKEMVTSYKNKVAEYTNLIGNYFYIDHNISKIKEPEIVEISEEFDSAASYWQSDPLMEHKGRFKINTYNWKTSPKSDVPYLAMHEANFGHHLHLTYNLLNKNIPRWLSMSHSTSVSEGWGLYTEYLLLKDEFGLFKLSDNEKISSINAMILRAMRLVLDIGIHIKNWSFEKCLEYSKRYLTDSEPELISEIYRYSVLPGQALSYVVGYKVIDYLYKKYRDENISGLDGFYKNSRYSIDSEPELEKKCIKNFHMKFLENSYLPLDFLIYEFTKNKID